MAAKAQASARAGTPAGTKAKKSAVKPMMTDAGIKAKTGKGWDYWFPALDKEGAAKLGHHAIAEILERKFDTGPWWGQMIAVSYERARGIRAMNQNCSGDFSVSVSKMMPVALSALFEAAVGAHAKWFPRGSFAESSRTRDKYFRGRWGGSGARLEINFTAKGPGKSQIVVQVNKLSGNEAVERERASWKKAIVKLEGMLGG